MDSAGDLSSLGRRSNPRSKQFLRIRGLYLLFFIAIYRAAFCSVLAMVCEAQLRLCFKNFIFRKFFIPFKSLIEFSKTNSTGVKLNFT